jgi:copper chaperone CopZ
MTETSKTHNADDGARPVMAEAQSAAAPASAVELAGLREVVDEVKDRVDSLDRRVAAIEVSASDESPSAPDVTATDSAIWGADSTSVALIPPQTKVEVDVPRGGEGNVTEDATSRGDDGLSKSLNVSGAPHLARSAASAILVVQLTDTQFERLVGSGPDPASDATRGQSTAVAVPRDRHADPEGATRTRRRR